MKTAIRIGVATVLLASAATLYGNKTYTPLPRIVFNGKAVFIENQTGDATLQHAVYLEFARSGRFEVAASRDQADVVISISGPNTVRHARQRHRERLSCRLCSSFRQRRPGRNDANLHRGSEDRKIAVVLAEEDRPFKKPNRLA
jgi:hypothetical protein